MNKHFILLFATVVVAILSEENASAREVKLSRGKHPRSVATVARMQYLHSRRLDALSPDVPALADPNRNDGDLLDVTREDEIGLEDLKSWGSWSEWTDCSRTCGGGVATRRRTCMSRFSSNILDLQCEGSSTAHKLCNTQECPPGSLEFREKQCAEHNDDAHFSRNFEWIPFSGKDGNSCELSCVAKNYHFYNSFGVAADGTRCGTGSKGICIESECVIIGCDGLIGSEVTKDMCGVCGGSNETCFQRQYAVDQLPEGGDLNSGYSKIAEIPVGATNVRVRDHNRNYLALLEVDGDHDRYVFNGDWVVSYPGEYKIAGTTVTYDRVKHKETIEIEGPTTTVMKIMVLSLGEQPLVEYEYWIPKSSQAASDGLSAFRMQQKVIFEVPSEEDYRNQILAAGLSFDAVALPTPEPTTTTIQTATTSYTTTVKTEMLTTTQGAVRRTTIRPGHCTSCKKTINKKKHFCDSDFVVHVRILPRRRLLRGRFVRYEVEVLNSYKNNARLMRREYIWISSTCCPRLRPYRHYLLMGQSIKTGVTSENHADDVDLNPERPRQFETRLLADHAEFWYTWRKYQIRMSRAAKRINCKRYRYPAAKYYRRHREG